MFFLSTQMGNQRHDKAKLIGKEFYMAEYFEGKSADEVWEKAAMRLLEQNNTIDGRTGEVYEVLHAFISIEDPKQKWIYNRIPPMSLAFALAELIWIMNGENDAKVINFWNPVLKKYAGNDAAYYGAYGKRIRSQFGFDQLEKAYQALQNVPESRQVVIQIYDTRTDFPIENGKPRAEDIPCNICSLLKVRNNKLEWTQIMRSNDVLLGLPYNFIQFTGLQEIMAGWLEIQVGTYNHYSDSLHLYKRDIDKIGIAREKKIENSDSLALNKIESDKIFKEMYERMIQLSNSKISEKDIWLLTRLKSQYSAYNNIMYVLGSYCARKRKMEGLAEEMINQCSNNLYKQMWQRWIHK